MPGRKMVVVTVSGPAHIAEIVKREVATALSHLGAFDVTSVGEFSNGNGQSWDPERLEMLASLAPDEVQVKVRRA